MGNDKGQSMATAQVVQGAPNGAAPRSGNVGLWVVVICLVAGSGLGVWVYFNAKSDVMRLSPELDQWRERGKTLSSEECVNGAIDWFKTCEAQGRICLDAVPRAVAKCLSAQDRSATCSTMGADMKSSQWAYDHCVEKGIDRKSERGLKESCTEAWRALDTYCKSGQEGVAL